MSRDITCVSIDLTTHCNLRCKNCCCAIGTVGSHRTLRHHPWEYFKALAPFIYGIDRANLTGGETTAHPQFAEFVPRFKDLFGCKRLTLSTNGFRVERYRAIIEQHVDEVHFSSYGANRAALVALRGVKELSVYDGGMDASNFTPRSHRGSGAPCQRGFSETASYADGKFYPCCVSPGLAGTEGLLPCVDWREKVQLLDMGCSNCFFSPGEKL